MDIKALAEKYNLPKTDFWDCHGNWIISHNAVEKIMAIENIVVTDIKVLNSERDFCRFLISCSKFSEELKEGELISAENMCMIATTKAITIGEASPDNCKNKYYGAMAEKRGIDRAVLKLINAYEFGIYSDVEADDFKRPSPQQKGMSAKETTRDKATDKQLDAIRRMMMVKPAEAMEIMRDRQLPKLTKAEASEVIDYIKSKEGK